MLKFTTTLALAAIATFSAVAQSPAETSVPTLQTATADEIKNEMLQHSHKILFVGSDDQAKASADSIAQMITLFYVDQFRSFQDPLAPYFLLMSKDAKLAMGVGGAVRMRGWGDFDGSVSTNGFVPYMIPVPADRDQRRRIGGTPGGTSLFFRIIGRNNTLGDITGYIQADFSGANNVGFKLKKAYVTIQDWTIGYASSTFSDGAAQAPTIDGAGQNGISSNTRLLLRWLHDFTPRWSMAASVELPSDNIDADGTLTKRLDDYLPDIALYGQYQWEHGQHIRLAAIARSLPYRDLVTGRSRTVTGWGLQLSTVLYPIPALGIYGEFSTGKGYSSYLGDLSIGNYDLITDATPGRLYAPLAMGLNIGARYNFNTKLYATTALGKAQYFPSYKVDGTDYRYGLYGSVCLFYEPTPRLQAGIEYLRGSRHNFNGMSNSANRIDILFQFSF